MTRSRGERAPALARPFVAVLLAAMIASALFVWEPWPVTSFRLFSHLREDGQTAWEATTVGAAGEERPYPLGSLPHGVRNFGFAMADFVASGTEQRDEACRAWVLEAPELVGREAVRVRIYQRTWRLSERPGDRALPGARELAFVCDRDGVAAIGDEVASG